MRRSYILIATVLCVSLGLLSSCGSGNASEGIGSGSEITGSAQQIDDVIEDPSEFLPFIHLMIEIDSLEMLRSLCHPDATRIRFNNANTLCNIRSDDMIEIDKFRGWFKNSSVIDAIRTDADTAWIPLQLGNGQRHPVAILEKDADRYYLVGFEWKK